MKKVFLSLALVAFLGATVVTANTVGTDKEKTSKTDEKKSDKKKKGTCDKKSSCCHKGDAKVSTTKVEEKAK